VVAGQPATNGHAVNGHNDKTKPFAPTNRIVKSRSKQKDVYDGVDDHVLTNAPSKPVKAPSKPASANTDSGNEEEEQGESDEFGEDGGIIDADELAELNAETLPDPQAEEKLISYILKSGEIPKACRTLREDDFESYELSELYKVLQFVPEPITIKDVLIADHHNMLDYGSEELKELREAADLHLDPIDLVKDIKKSMLKRKLDHFAQDIDFYALKHPEKISYQLKELMADADSYFKPQAESMEMISLGDLLDKKITKTYLIDGIMAANQQMVMGGLSKTLKTKLALQMALSLVTATPYLGKFNVPAAVPVGFWSAESGDGTIQATAVEMLKTMEVDGHGLPLHLCFRVPHFTDAESMAQLEAKIVQYKLKVAIIDPAYLAMHTTKTAGQAGNVFMTGAILQELTRIGHDNECTIVLLHHFRKTGNVDYNDPAGIEELSMAGFTEWMRQWILINRRVKYNHDGKHSLWLNIGGGAGHGDAYALDIDEGQFPNLKWSVPLICKESEYKQQAAAAAEDAKQAAEHTERLTLWSQAQLVLAEAGEQGLAEKKFREAMNLGQAKMQKLIAWGKVSHRIAETKVTVKNGNKVTRYKLDEHHGVIDEAPVAEVDEDDESNTSED
jgi:hypothetical protein